MTHAVLGQGRATRIDGQFGSQYQATDVHDNDSPVNLLTKGKRRTAGTQQHHEHTGHHKANDDTLGAAIVEVYGWGAAHWSSTCQ
jgi:hypothetical protein